MSPEEFPKKELETLWAPWRVEYFEKEPRSLNFLSEAAQASDDAAHLVIARRKNAFLMMNRYPYSVGHLMAVPYRKVAELSALGDNEVVELWNLVVHAQRFCVVRRRRRDSISVSILASAQARVCQIICISTSSRAGAATPILCRSSPARARSRMGCAPCMIN